MTIKHLKVNSFLLFFLSFAAFSQTPSISGKVINPQKEAMEFVSVVVMHPKDSTMITFTTTDINGAFEIKEKSRDSILVQLFCTGYLPFYKNINYTNKSVNLGTITLEENIDLLDEVVISAVIPMQIKKDTVAFNASSFKINHDDNIEELIKKLPGIEVGSDGKVVAQGNEVTKIFVDGKEFFGGDPAIVLKNLPADAISKIQVIDKKSEEAELSGVSDGNKEVVINFSLKETRKKQGFGKASSGVGLDSRYFGNLNFNQFSPKTQFSIIGKFNNINITGTNIQDFLKNADGLGDDSDETGTVRTRKLSGYLTTAFGGLHYGHEFKKNESFNVDYFYNYSENHGKSNSKRISFLTINNIEIDSEKKFASTNEKHNFNFNYKNRTNKNNRLIMSGKIYRNLIESDYNKVDNRYVGEIQNIKFDANSKSTSNKKTASIQGNYYQTINTSGRNFSTGFSAKIYHNDYIYDQNSLVEKKLNTSNPTEETIVTHRDEVNKQNTLTYNIKYTEPINKNHYLVIYGHLLSKTINQDGVSSRNDNKGNNQFDYIFNYDELSFKTSISHSYNTGKINFKAGVEIHNMNRSFGEVGKELLKTNKHYYNPILFLQYVPKKGKKYRFNYKQYVKNPRSYQSTTVVNDLNPNNIRIGNPDILPEKNHSVSFLSILHNYVSSSSFYVRLNFLYTNNAIIQTIEINEDDYIRTRSYENSGNRKSISSSLSYSNKIKSTGIRYNLKNKNSYRTSNSLVNLNLNDVISKDFSLGISFENFKKSIFDIKAGSDVSINITEFSLQDNLNREYLQQRYYTSFDHDFSKKLNFNTQFDYLLFTDSNESISSNQKLPLWNAAISYSFNKGNILKFVMIDLLNKNVDINRRSTLNYFEETTTKSLGRYFIISYTYRLNGGTKRKSSKRKKWKKK
jgi:hypothetical protein